MERLDRKARKDALKIECMKSYLRKPNVNTKIISIIVDYKSTNRLIGIHRFVLSSDSDVLDTMPNEVIETMDMFKEKEEDGATLFSCMELYDDEKRLIK